MSVEQYQRSVNSLDKDTVSVQRFESIYQKMRIHLFRIRVTEKSTCFRKCFFQRNPPFRVGEIPLRGVIYACGV